MEISTTPQTAAATTQVTSSSSTATSITSDFETFLQMLTAQARYQDPLEPIDSTEYASQLAQFSAVEQQVQTNDLLTAMSTQLGSSNMAQYASWIGMEARSTAPVHFDGQPVTLLPTTAAAADQAFLVVSDSAGAEVQRLTIPVSTDPVQWAGVSNSGTPFTAGEYSFNVESFASGQLIDTQPAESYARINEARVVNGQTVLILDGDVQVEATSISALRETSDV